MPFSSCARADLASGSSQPAKLSVGCGCGSCQPFQSLDRADTWNRSFADQVTGQPAALTTTLKTVKSPLPSDISAQPDYVEALLKKGAYSWSGDVRYTFMTAVPSYYGANNGAWKRDDDTVNQFAVLSDPQRQAIRIALAEWQKVSGIRFVEVPSSQVDDSIELKFGVANTSTSSVSGWAYTPGTENYEGDVWLDRDHPDNAFIQPGQAGFWTILHEIGHAIGLKHPFDGTPQLTGTDKTLAYTVMAYDFDPFYQSLASDDYRHPKTPQLYDVAAVQFLYGTNPATNSGSDDVFTWANGQNSVETIWDAGGDRDVLDASNQTGQVVINLAPGERNSIGGTNNITIAYGTTIERARGGSGDDWIYGNSEENALYGNGGKDYIYGDLYGTGNDIVFGGEGDDYLYGQDGNDFLSGDAGNDTVFGGGGDDNIYGLSGGLDTFTGGTGADRFVVGGSTNYYPSYFEYATIEDFNLYEGDKLGLHGGIGDYLLIQNQSWIGGAANDTAVYYNNNLVALLKDTTNFSLSRDASYWT